MFDSLLIANRGEIARRIMRTAKRLGVRSIAVYSDADADMPFVREADEAIRLGPPPAQESYLRADRIMEAARQSGAKAVHPGYGFLSENADFAELVCAAGLAWVGAPPAAIRAMGMKDTAKRLMQRAGVPVTPGYVSDNQSDEELRIEADKIGYPVLIKAVAGGGGRGMRRVNGPEEFEDALASCRREAQSAFGDGRVLLEKYIAQPRHIEVQVFGDLHGNIVHLFERDCSVQRRHQKIIEEAPAPGMDAATRAAVTASAVQAAKAVSYVGAGTVEFIADASEGLRPDRVWFMEMNTRLQVEHPVTEAITGLDLVEWQLRVAAGERLPATQDKITIRGWAVEARLYAEDPSAGYLPSTGELRHLQFPDWIRIDSGVEQGDAVTQYYDPMIAKLVAHSDSREHACADLAKACRAVEVWPVKTNLGLLTRILTDAEFLSGKIDTGFIDRNSDRIISAREPSGKVKAAAAAMLLQRDDNRPWESLHGFRGISPPDNRVTVEIDGALYLADPAAAGVARGMPDGQVLFLDGGSWLVAEPRPKPDLDNSTADGLLVAPMTGVVTSVDIAAGQSVKRGQRILTMEAMKMEYALPAPFDGTVVSLDARVGMRLDRGAPMGKVERLES